MIVSHPSSSLRSGSGWGTRFFVHWVEAWVLLAQDFAAVSAAGPSTSLRMTNLVGNAQDDNSVGCS